MKLVSDLIVKQIKKKIHVLEKKIFYHSNFQKPEKDFSYTKIYILIFFVNLSVSSTYFLYQLTLIPYYLNYIIFSKILLA